MKKLVHVFENKYKIVCLFGAEYVASNKGIPILY